MDIWNSLDEDTVACDSVTWPRPIVRRTYDDDDNTFIHLFTVLTIAICCVFTSWQLAENVYKANGIEQ